MSSLDTDAPAATLLALPRLRPNEGRSPAIRFVPPATDSRAADASLAARLATAPGLVRTGAARWDDGRTPIHPLSLESAYADPALLGDLGARGARFARDLGADVAGRRVLLVDDAVSSGTAVERFTASLAGAGAEVVGVFVLVDMRDVADTVTDVASALPTESVSTYLQVLTLATANGLLDPAVHDLSVDAILNHWTEDDPRWDLLLVAA